MNKQATLFLISDLICLTSCLKAPDNTAKSEWIYLNAKGKLVYKKDDRGNRIIEYVVKNIFNRLSNRDLIHFDEKYIKIMLLGCLFQSRAYVSVSEVETDSGYVDIILFRSPLVPEVRYEWVFELKYFKSGGKSMAAHRRDAQNQLQRYTDSVPLKDRKDVKKAVILFVGKNKYELFEN
jgi:hypothetical protein